MSNDSLGDRMKSYEDCYRLYLPIRSPIILRIDGKAFHSYTRGCQKPVDENLIGVMNDTAKYLCENIQGAQLGYVQSDEISLLLVNYKSLDSQSWFDNNLQKMVSVSAGMASGVFTGLSGRIWGGNSKIAVFNSRAFLVPKEDVVNYFQWRQQDATRNSVQMLARSLYSHRECENKNNSELQEMCFRKGVNWNDCPVPQKRGRGLVKVQYQHTGVNPKTGESIPSERSEWRVDNNIPIFSENRNYVEKFVYPTKPHKMALSEEDIENMLAMTKQEIPNL
jgi:tRNA(His) 5'-end guanylyltransferase